MKTNHHRGVRSVAGIFICLILVMGSVLPLYSQDLETVQARLSQVETIQADFIQEKHLPILQKPLVSKGRLYFKAPRSLRWEYREPLVSLTLLHQGQMARWQADWEGNLQRVGGEMAAMQRIFNDLVDWLGGRFTEGNLFHTQLAGENHLVLKPLDARLEGFISQIDLHLNDSADYLQTVVIHEGDQGFTRMEFVQVVLNESLSESLFREAVP